MFSKPLAVGLLAIACVTAAAGGAYVAVQHNDTPQPGAAVTAPAGTNAVQDTEAVVAPATAPSTPAPLPVEPASEGAAFAPAPLLPRTTTPAPRPRPTAADKPSSRRAVPTAPAPARRTGPAVSGAGNPLPAPDVAAVSRVETAEPAHPEPLRAEPPPPAAPELLELVIPSASVIGLQIETPVSTDRARIEDRVDARVMRDVTVDGRTAIPAGTRALGAVTLVERGGKVKERARLGVRFHTLVLADGTQLPIRTDTILREGDSPAGESAAKIGGAAVGGAILGALMGGKKGAIVGGATGAAGGTAVVMTGDRNAATLASGAIVTVRLSTPVSVEVERR